MVVSANLPVLPSHVHAAQAEGSQVRTVLIYYYPQFGPALPILYTRIWHVKLFDNGILKLWDARGFVLSFDIAKLRRFKIDGPKHTIH